MVRETTGPRARRPRGGSSYRMSTPVLGLMMVLALVGLGAMWSGLQEQRALTATTTGRILSGETHGTESRGQRCRAVVAYRVDGYAYRVDGLVGGPCPEQGASDRTTVHYDPAAPGHADTRPPSRAPYGTTAAATMGTLFCAYHLVVRGAAAVRRRREPSPHEQPRSRYS